MALIRIRAARQCVRSSQAVHNARSLRTVWSSPVTTLNPDQGSVSSESIFRARVESPIKKGPNFGFEDQMFMREKIW